MAYKKQRGKRETTAKQDSPEKSNSSLIELMKIIIPVLGTIIVAVISYYQVRTTIYVPIWATQTAQTTAGTTTQPTSENVPLPSPTAVLNETSLPASTSASATDSPTDTPAKQPAKQPNVTSAKPDPTPRVTADYILEEYEDFRTPNTVSYQVKVEHTETTYWKFSWCTQSETQLHTNLDNMIFDFYIDDILVPESNFITIGSTTENNWACQEWITMLTNWNPGTTVKLSVKQTILNVMTDGVAVYQPGEYRHDIFATVR